jgi:glycosyltransferase involved in cell wall biosynthesis
VQALLVQHNPAFFREEAFGRLLRTARENGVPVAVTMHATQGVRIDPDLASELAAVQRIYVHRESDAAWLAGHSIEEPVRVISQGIPRLPERSMDWVKSEIGLGGKFLVGHFGFLRPHKGVLELIEAFEVLVRSSPSAHLLLLCSEYPSTDSHEYRLRCEKRIADSPVSARIHASFDHLSLDAAGFLLQACDLLVFPYHPSKESASAAVRLAIASMKPIVVSGSGIFEELHGIAEIAPSLEPDALAATIASLASGPLRAAAERRTRRFAARLDLARVGPSLWGDLRSLGKNVREGSAHSDQPDPALASR